MAEAFTSRRLKGSKLTKDEGDDLWAPKFTQAGHGLAVGDVARRSAAGTYAKAQANTEANIGVGLGIVVRVSGDDFDLLRAGETQTLTLTSHGFGAFGTRLWLSQSVAGAITATQPSSGLAVYLGYVIDANTIQWEGGWRFDASQLTSGLLAAARGGLGADASAFAGIVKMGSGVASVAVAGTDYAAASHNHAAGDITSGQLALARGGTNLDLSAVAAGALLRGATGGGALESLALGSDGQFLTVSAGQAAWGAAPGGALTVLDRVTADAQVVNDNSEQTLYSLSVTNNAASGVVEVALFGSYLNSTGSGRTVVIRIKLGATTLYDATTNSLASAVLRRGFWLRFFLQNRAATNSQQLTGKMIISSAGSPTTGLYGAWSTGFGGTAAFGNTAAEDWTSAKTLAVTVQHSVADANLSITLRGGAVLRY